MVCGFLPSRLRGWGVGVLLAPACAILVAGCEIAPDEMAVLHTEARDVTAPVLSPTEEWDSGGGELTVNEPWTARILAVVIGLYLLKYRNQTVRRAFDFVQGKHRPACLR